VTEHWVRAQFNLLFPVRFVAMQKLLPGAKLLSLLLLSIALRLELPAAARAASDCNSQQHTSLACTSSLVLLVDVVYAATW
jgi:hypothetical protein